MDDSVAVLAAVSIAQGIVLMKQAAQHLMPHAALPDILPSGSGFGCEGPFLPHDRKDRGVVDACIELTWVSKRSTSANSGCGFISSSTPSFSHEPAITRSHTMPPSVTSSMRVRCVHLGRSIPQSRSLSHSSQRAATPLAHPTIAGAPPPPPPQQSVSYAGGRLERRRAQAETLTQGQQKKTDPAKPASALSKRFWKEVSVQESGSELQILLDRRAVRTASKKPLALPRERRMLASAVALEWDQLVTAQQALKQHYIPWPSRVSRALDIQAADLAENTTIRESIVKVLMRYLATDTLLCWAPTIDSNDPDNQFGRRSLRERQKAVAEPIIAHLQTHIFPGVQLEPTLSEDSILPRPQPEMTTEVIRGWINGLPAFDLAALERGVLATKSLLIAIRLLVEWSREFKDLAKSSERRFGIEQAAEASTQEVLYQLEVFPEVEDTHDVDAADLRRQLGSVILLVS